MESEYLIIGGGVVGLSLAWGLLRRGHSVLVLDGGDVAYSASRGNFGLVWVQSKGLDQPAYARWTQCSAAKWAELAQELEYNTGHDVSLQQQGGYDFHFNEQSLQQCVQQYEALKLKLNGDYPFDVLDNAALKQEEPNIGPAVSGAVLHHQDGHVNPLRLLKALADDVCRMGGMIKTGQVVCRIGFHDGFTAACCNGDEYFASKVVLAAGLGAADLAPQLGFQAPIQPQRGQILITEKLPMLMNRPSGIIRQVDEGGVQIGDSKEDVGFDDSVTLDVASSLAARAVSVYPDLARARLVRNWAALRILTPDGLPIYQKSASLPGAFFITCHSGVTLAAAHAYYLPQWLQAHESAPDLEVFSEQRFTVC